MKRATQLTCVVVFLMLFSAASAIAQSFHIKGITTDESTQKPLPQVAVTVSGANSKSAVSDNDGRFLIEGLRSGKIVIRFSVSGFEETILETNLHDNNADLGTVSLKPLVRQGLSELMVADLEVDMETDVQEISPLLTSSRDPFNNIASYTFSPVRYRQRGYEGQYSDVYLNGIPMNDMTTGNVIWALWGGLNDATRNQENYIGLETGNYAFGNIGGVSNIITRASRYRTGTRLTYSYSNRTYSNRAMITHSTGMMDNGWALTVSGSHRWGERGYVNGVFYNAWAYFMSLEKKINDAHTLSLTALGAPTERGVANGSTQEAYDLVGFNFYNPNIGLQNGKWRNARVRDNHEPIFVFNHYWNIDEKSRLTTSLGYRFGRNGYSALNWSDAPDPRPDYYRYLPSYYDTEGKTDLANEVREMWFSDPNTRYINWQKLYNVNYNNYEEIKDADGKIAALGKRSKYIIEDRRNDQKQFTFSTVFNSDLSEHLKFDWGMSFRHNVTSNFKTIKDLLGGEYWYDIDQFAERDFASDPSKYQTDLRNPYRAVVKGSRYGYDYDAVVQDFTEWAMLHGMYRKFDFYTGLRFGNQTFHRVGKYQKGLFPDNSYGNSESKSFFHYAVKGGFTYKISGRHYLSANGAYMENAPNFTSAFISPRTRNTTIGDMETEKVLSGDLNYHFRSPFVKGRLTAYYTRISDQTKILSFYDDFYRSFGNYVMTGIDTEHTGVEFGMEAKLSPTITAQGMFGYGQNKYINNPNYSQTVDNTEELLESDRVYWENFNVEGSPMTVASLGLTYNSPNYWWVGISGNYFDRAYLSMNPVLRTDKARAQLAPEYIKQEKFDGGFTLDAFAGVSYRIQYKYFLGINVSASNLLDNKGIKSGGYEQLRIAQDRTTQTMRNPFDPKYFYMFGRTYFLNVNFRF